MGEGSSRSAVFAWWEPHPCRRIPVALENKQGALDLTLDHSSLMALAGTQLTFRSMQD